MISNSLPLPFSPQLLHFTCLPPTITALSSLSLIDHSEAYLVSTRHPTKRRPMSRSPRPPLAQSSSMIPTISPARSSIPFCIVLISLLEHLMITRTVRTKIILHVASTDLLPSIANTHTACQIQSKASQHLSLTMRAIHNLD